MNPELQRVKIAEACGWKNMKLGRRGLRGAFGDGYRRSVPDYLSDLNSCAEMERVLTDEQRDAYALELIDAYGDEAIFATAPQRCEAFLRVMGLWQDS